jgi:kumamolisin
MRAQRAASIVAVGAVCALIAVVAVSSGSGGRAADAASAGVLGHASPIGPLSKSAQLRLELGLANPRSTALGRLIAAGRTVSPQTFDRSFLPSQRAVSQAETALAAAGLKPQWAPGSEVVQVAGTAGSVERAFGVQLERYRRSDGSTFYAPTAPPRLSAPLRSVVGNVSGLDDRARDHNLSSTTPTSGGCGAGAGGYTPGQVMSAYDFNPLLHASLNGRGQTIVFIEIDTFQQRDLNCFAGKFGGGALSVKVAPHRWGSPQNTAGSSDGSESELDLEIVHAIAPAAKLVVYDSDSRASDIAAAAQAAVAAYPKAIFSVSIGGCEVEELSNGQAQIAPDEQMWDNALKRLAATGGSAFIASGDSGAYTCGSQLTSARTGAELPSVSSPASDPYATSVGGTALFVSPAGQDRGEAAWGAPFEGDGSGGGISDLWQRPSWQTGRGTSNSYSNGARELPDVSSLGDPNTGWDVYVVGDWSVVAGTSAAAPLWAGLTALADQKLSEQGLPAVGFANLPIYAFGGAPARWPAKAFNDVTAGENLYYPATPGWDPATGWGSPNAAGLVQDLLAYERAAH